MEANELILAAIPFFVVFMLVEFLVGQRRSTPVYETRDTAASLAMGAVNVILSVGIDVLLLLTLAAVYRFRLFTLPDDAWWSWALAIVAFDFCFYWMHRFHHEVRVFWAAHVNHHSSRRYNYSTALRQSWTEPLTAIPFWLPLSLLGFEPKMVLFALTIDLLYQFLVHTELVGRLGPIEWIFNTPSHHRVHHGSNLRYLDKNYGGIFIVWDRLFGTFQAEEDDEKVVYGLTANIETFNPLRIAFHEWAALARDVRRREGLRDRWKTLASPPGWDPNGKTLTVTELRSRRVAASTSSPPDASVVDAPCSEGGGPDPSLHTV